MEAISTSVHCDCHHIQTVSPVYIYILYLLPFTHCFFCLHLHIVSCRNRLTIFCFHLNIMTYKHVHIMSRSMCLFCLHLSAKYIYKLCLTSKQQRAVRSLFSMHLYRVSCPVNNSLLFLIIQSFKRQIFKELLYSV